MKEKYTILRIALKRYRRRLHSKAKQKKKKRDQYRRNLSFSKIFPNKTYDIERIYEIFMPTSMSYLLNTDNSPFSFEKLLYCNPSITGTIKVPKKFSIVDEPEASFAFLQEVTAATIFQVSPIITLDYSDCESIDLGAQVFLDIILRDIIKFYRRCKRFPRSKKIIRVKTINAEGINNPKIRKLLFSVGSPAIHLNKSVSFKDIIPYKLCVHDRDLHRDAIKIREQKDLDSTKLVDYVLQCLKRVNRELTPEKIDDLSIVIGEILINAEEHSTTKNRFSIGYFHEINENDKHYGVFRLVILNFGKTIYEKFSDSDCKNKSTVEKMRLLSKKYTTENLFKSKSFEEETLWTLYALQEGVTSIDPTVYKKRGNGSIQFIESFFNLRGDKLEYVEDHSRMVVLSGNARIEFDGTYGITSGDVDGEEYKFMTFNHTGNIEDKPDAKFVKFVDNYFPGTIISTKILFNEDDITIENEK